MGNPLYSDDIGAMCFNAAKSWQLSWYNDNKLAIDPRQQRTWMGTMVGVADFGNNPNQYPVVIKIETGTESAIETEIGIGVESGVGTTMAIAHYKPTHRLQSAMSLLQSMEMLLRCHSFPKQYLSNIIFALIDGCSLQYMILRQGT